jgi:hypothetical protein
LPPPESSESGKIRNLKGPGQFLPTTLILILRGFNKRAELRIENGRLRNAPCLNTEGTAMEITIRASCMLYNTEDSISP